jgi:hypothetical protein
LRNLPKALNHKGPYLNKVLNILKLILVLLTFGFVFYKLFYAYHIRTLYHEFVFDLSPVNLFLPFLAILLAAFNWLIESFKWQLLISKIERVDLKGAIISVLCGVTLGMITPNQIGTFAGRVLHLKEYSKLKGSLVSVIGHTAQMIMTMAFGVFAGLGFLFTRGYTGITSTVLIALLLFIILMIVFYAYLNIDRISFLWKKSAINEYLQVFSGYSTIELGRVLSYSFFRFIIFLIQYLLLIQYYHIGTTIQQSIMCICGSLFIQAFVPSFLLLDIGMRGASALWLFGFYTQQPTAVLLMTYSIWMINLLLPGMAGLYLLTQWKGKLE